ncbi:aminotransferase class I/II-fold pyridoxal phosphate-dependent enzyme [bacterium]|jgi:alanine-synthesizing transaminase|nr:aminotransferase class I/II-fold pyridoxal phosphate-dependent enzyme [bacterium]MBT3850604.1 aminotransferase class I/II-fold pyridoxal phosphate-dependent enzyme [bacterium]MDG2445506.1 aminotransferase class I/II-fold pyridoxal phosphate-dependent enzyme [Thermodesulfobacteriota bacterium]|tara:strand:+ start:3571 stop:4743 length:1173 start_codon:yes stop_codon:yes gene_type:complete
MSINSENFSLLSKLPQYVFSSVNELKYEARKKGEDIIDFGMGNPDQPTPRHIIEKLLESATQGRNHRYSVSAGLPKLRLAITNWYKRNYDVELDPDNETIVTIGSKEGLSHLMISLLAPGETVLVPDPCYPIHSYSVLIARGNIKEYNSIKDENLLMNIEKGLKSKPKALIISFPSNPTTQTVDIDFFTKIVDLAKKYSVIVIHDFAYADICFDNYKAPSFLQASGAMNVGVESFSLSKSYNMAGWRVGFMSGNREVISALKRVKSYLDYGIFQPIQISAITALNETQDCVKQTANIYKERRNRLVDGLSKIGWEIELPKATMFVWAKIPEQYLGMGSLEFSKKLIKDCKVAVSPGVGFGPSGDEFVRFALIENEQRIQQAARSMKKLFV